MIMSILSIILLAASFPIDIARAAPWHTVHARQSNGSGNNNNNGGLSSSVWIPVVFIGGLFLLSAVWVLQKKMTGGSTNASGNAVPNSTVTGQTRELTAEDLASGTRPTNTRRQRRPRRTPSQVSTRSLPAYMKEPGDNEVVIYRGLEDMDEEPEGELHNAQNSTTTTADMTMDTGRTDRDSHDDTHALLQFRTDSPELMRHSVHLTRGSYDHHGSDDSHARLIDVQRGEAPAYETIDLNATEGPVTAHGHQNSQSAGVSGFFSRFMPQRGNNGNSSELTTLRSPPSDSLNHIIPSSHSREPSAQSGTSGVASADSHDLPRRSHADRTHRNNNSSTGSVFTLFSRTIPRNHDDGPLTSPSTLSLNSISPPLTHTATRTEFTYPRTGPTSEQVKFLSSKETFGRFGVPYGPDAIAFAASSSRLDLPPDFDSEHRPSFSDLLATPDDGLASNLRRSTSAGRLSTDDHSDLGGFALPESAEPSQDRSLTDLDQPPPSMRELTPDLEVDAIPPPSRDPLSKQKSTPNLGVGHPSLLKSAFKSKSISNLQKDGGGSLLPRSASAAGSYLTVESFQTAHDDGDDSVPLQSLGPLPQITVQMPSNNPSSVNLVEERSDSEAEFFDGEDDTEGSEVKESFRGRGTQAQRVPSLSEGHQSHAQGRGQEVIKEGDTPSRRTQNSRAYSLSTNSDDESDADTHSNHTGVGKAADMEPRNTQRLHGMMDPEMVAITLKKTSPNSTKAAVETSRTTTIEA